jgi:hypothetical protein
MSVTDASDQPIVRNVPHADCIWIDVHGSKRFAFEIPGAITLGQVSTLCNFDGCEITFRQFEWQSHGSLAMCCRTLMPETTIEQVSRAIECIQGRAAKFKIQVELLKAKHQEGA